MLLSLPSLHLLSFGEALISAMLNAKDGKMWEEKKTHFWMRSWVSFTPNWLNGVLKWLPFNLMLNTCPLIFTGVMVTAICFRKCFDLFLGNACTGKNISWIPRMSLWIKASAHVAGKAWCYQHQGHSFDAQEMPLLKHMAWLRQLDWAPAKCINVRKEKVTECNFKNTRWWCYKDWSSCIAFGISLWL